jgi:hypothetical protein
MEEIQQAVAEGFSKFDFILSYGPACFIQLVDYGNMMADTGCSW